MPAAKTGFVPDFDDFLFAPIGEDKHGMMLSVLSALARLDVDPWQEAAQLAGLSAEAATRRLAALLAALPAGPALQQEPSKIASRLIRLLPQRDGHDRSMRDVDARDGTMSDARSAFHMIVLSAIFMVLVMGIQLAVVGRQISAPVANAHASTSGPASAKPPEVFPGS